MIKGIGVDILDLQRIRNTNMEALAKKILVANEYEVYCNLTLEDAKVEFLGSRFCAKEAVYKALSLVMKEPFYKVEICKNEFGVPYGKYQDYTVMLSISHEKDYVIAYALFQ